MGTVTDPSGAAVRGASVELLDPATGKSYKTVTGPKGTYSLANVPPGPGYKETITSQGFETTILTDIYMNVAATRTQDVKLSVGSVSSTVSVSASSQDVTLNTTDATVGNNFEVQYVNELPVSYRDTPAALLTQQPGMTQSGSATGARTDQTRITLDGLDVNDMAGGTFAKIVANAPVDSVQEFRGTTAGMLASAGAGGGGQFEMVTKSGSNHFHGNINEYHRDTDLEANEWFNNFDGVSRSPLIRNQFGGNLGGPFWKDKAFFFFDYNGRRDVVAGQTTRTVPTTSFQNQNITYYTNITAGTTSSINAAQTASYDPQLIGFDQNMMKLFNGRYPAPNDFTGDAGDLLNTAGYRFNSPEPYHENNYVGRVDLNPFQSHHFFGRVTYTKINGINSAVQFPTDPVTFPVVDTSHAWVVGWDWSIGANKTNSVIWGSTIANLAYPDDYNPQGTTAYSFDGDPTGGDFLTAPYAGPGSSARYFPIPVVRDDFQWTKGSHSFSFGGSFKYPTPQFSNVSDYNSAGVGLGGGVTGLTDSDTWQFRPTDLDRNQTSLTVYDSAFVTALGRFGSSGASWNYNSAGNVLSQGTGFNTKYKYYETEFYFEDSWKATPSLTITYGLRYQNFTVPYEVHGLESVQSQSFWGFMNARIAQSNAGVSGDASVGTAANQVPLITYGLGGKANNGPAYFQPSNLNFAPRIAFAWTPDKAKKLVINGGASVVYDQTIVNAFLQEQSTGYSYLFAGSGGQNFGVAATAAHSAAYNSLLENQRFTSLTSPPTLPTAPAITKPYSPFVAPGDPNCAGIVDSGPCGLAEGGAFNISVDKNLPTPYNLMFNLGMQQEFRGGFIFKLGYVGRLGRRLLAQADGEQLLDFPDTQSGQKLSQAMAALTTWIRQNPNADPSTAPAQPWFEHVLTANGTGESNTGYIASTCSPYPARGDGADTVQCMALHGILPSNVGMAAQFSENTFFTDMGFSAYNGMLITLHKNNSHGLQFDLNYTWSHSIDNVSLVANSYAYEGYGFICDVTRPRLCRGNSDFNLAGNFNGNFLYQIPIGRGRDYFATMPRWADEAVGGWELSGLPSWHTGTPFMGNSVAFLMSYSNEDPALLTGSKGPLQSHVTKQSGQVYDFRSYQQAFNQYTAPVGFQMGERNNLNGPGYFNMDMGLGKTFPIWRELNLKFRADAFNVFNHPNFETPSFQNNMSLVASPNEFGVIPGTVVPNGADESARVLQGALRLEF
ncbi:MAG: carboxypeptidase-like regulatory domain-containing protein [Silvibacterium sp.]